MLAFKLAQAVEPTIQYVGRYANIAAIHQAKLISVFHMNRFLYTVLLYVLSPLLLVYLGFRAIKSVDYRGRWGERFGLAKLMPTDVLIHSVSMGETLAAIPLIRLIRQHYPDLHLTVTTTSPTGSAQVRRAFAAELNAGQMQHCYLPFDLLWSVKRFLRQLSPKWCLIMETELWPNLVAVAKQQGVKLMLANGRLSAKSAAQYAKHPRLTAPMLGRLDAIAVQTQAEALRFIKLGVPSDNISVCGSLKFDLTISPELADKALQLRQGWQRASSPIWVAGSVHPGEFDAVLAAHKSVLSKWPDALLIIAPRHPEQFDAVALAVANKGFTFVRRSEQQSVDSTTQVLVGDTMGELLTFYGAADQAFVGGSLIVHGGHNPLEPVAMGLPVLCGPNHRDFAQITQMLQAAGALRIVDSPAALAAHLCEYFAQPALAETAAAAGLAVVEANRGALQRQFALVETLFNRQ